MIKMAPTKKVRPLAALAAAALLILAGCASGRTGPLTPSAPPTTASPTSTSRTAEAIVADLRTEGFEASDPKPADPGYVEDVGGHSWDLKIGKGKGRSDGINIFPNPEALGMRVELSKSFGGIAVTGDVWAVSLETDGGYRDASLELASKIAEALDGEVQK
jgi:hypothetical protein